MRAVTRRRAVLAAFLAGMIMLMTRQSRTGGSGGGAGGEGFGIFSPFMSAINYVFDGTGDLLHDYMAVVGANRENRELRNRLAKLELTQLGYEEMIEQNRRMRLLLDLKAKLSCPSTAAEVIGGSPAGWSRTITIDKGSADGLAVNMAVMGSKGLIGRIYAVASHSAKVLLIVDSKSSVSVRFRNSRAESVMRGGPTCVAGSIEREVEVADGEELVTSGVDELYPSGIPVGVAHNARITESAVFQEADVKTHEGFNRIEEVLVLLSGRDCLVR